MQRRERRTRTPPRRAHARAFFKDTTRRPRPCLVVPLGKVPEVAAFKLRPIRKGLGVEVVGFDFMNAPSAGTIQALRDALLAHGLLLFRGRTLEPGLQIAFTSVLGGGVHRCSPPTRVIPQFPEIFRVSNRADQGNVNNGRYWHSDGAYLELPTAVTLHHIIRPTPDGDTLYADLASAYERLHPRDRARFEALKTVAQVPSIAHPLVRKHPVTGRTILYVNLEPRAKIVDRDGTEQPELAAFLREHLNRGCYRHKWRAGDLVVVDNYAAAHCATPAHPDALRVLHRTTVPGQRVWWQGAADPSRAALPDIAEPVATK
jgi:taurine dioxygenase